MRIGKDVAAEFISGVSCVGGVCNPTHQPASWDIVEWLGLPARYCVVGTQHSQKAPEHNILATD
jgi:hypothetical protein